MQDFVLKRTLAQELGLHPNSVPRLVKAGRCPEPDLYLFGKAIWLRAKIDAFKRALAEGESPANAVRRVTAAAAKIHADQSYKADSVA